jgi:uncharacterized glyoxalase superfamily protein PhnB
MPDQHQSWGDDFGKCIDRYANRRMLGFTPTK